MTSKKLQLLMLGCLVSPAILQAQSLKENYIQWQNNKGDKLFRSVEAWQNRGKVTDDDNFFISRVKPKARFRNEKTQVLQNLNETNDKRLVASVLLTTPKPTLYPMVFSTQRYSLCGRMLATGATGLLLLDVFQLL